MLSVVHVKFRWVPPRRPAPARTSSDLLLPHHLQPVCLSLVAQLTSRRSRREHQGFRSLKRRCKSQVYGYCQRKASSPWTVRPVVPASMASPAHCFYCFECISASFAGGEPPKLSVLEDLWDEYEAARDLDLEPDDEDSEIDDGPANGSLEAPTRTPPRPAGTLKLRSISRLQEDVSASASSSESSNSTTPSALSTSSSRSVLTNATSVSVADTPVPRSSNSPSSGSGSRSRYLRSSAGSTFPLFVTWNTVSRSGHKSLRGCIGTFEALELEEGLKTYATTSYVSTPYSD